MSDIRRIQQQIRASYIARLGQNTPVPLQLQAEQWCLIAQDYMSCATLIDGSSPQRWLPRLQMTGHAIEAALKGCLAAAQVPPPNWHDLVRLYEVAAEQGFQLSDPELAWVVHAGHFYFQDLATGTTFKTRYPASTTESVGGAVPEDGAFQSVVNSLVEQARRRGPW